MTKLQKEDPSCIESYRRPQVTNRSVFSSTDILTCHNRKSTGVTHSSNHSCSTEASLSASADGEPASEEPAEIEKAKCNSVTEF